VIVISGRAAKKPQDASGVAARSRESRRPRRDRRRWLARRAGPAGGVVSERRRGFGGRSLSAHRFEDRGGPVAKAERRQAEDDLVS
jgi:hypothetical protein